jgi:hypothetical protein
MHGRIFFLFLGLTLAATTWAGAQSGQDFGGGDFQERLLEYKRTQLGPALGVDQQTVNKLLAIDERYKPMRRQLVAGLTNDRRRLQQLMTQASPPEKEIKAILADMKRKRLEMHTMQQRKDDEETALLNPMQQARYLLYLTSLIKEARSVKGGTWGPAVKGVPGTMGNPAGRTIPSTADSQAGQGLPGTAGTPGGLPVPTLLPSETPASRPPQ